MTSDSGSQLLLSYDLQRSTTLRGTLASQLASSSSAPFLLAFLVAIELLVVEQFALYSLTVYE